MSMHTELVLTRIGGIEVRLHRSLVIVAVLLMLGLGGGVFPAWHPEWRGALVWALALIGALLFVASVFAHEIAHALADRALGIKVRSVTLFVFGGMAHLEREPPSWRVEVATALAGPVASLALAMLGIFLASSLAGPPPPAETPADVALATLGPVATLFLWLGQTNLLLVVFNLIPGFPLDGGRLLRGVLWAFSGDLRRATRLAAGAGQVFSLLIIAVGLAMILGIPVPVLGPGLVTGLWLALVGWFLHGAALMSSREHLIGDSLEGVTVARVMHDDFVAVPSGATLDRLVEQYLLPGEQHAFPVLDGGDFVGVVSVRDVRKIPREAWGSTAVRDVMTPAAGVRGVQPQTEAADAMVALGRQGVNQLPVIENGKLRGLVSREDILKQLSLYGDPALAQ